MFCVKNVFVSWLVYTTGVDVSLLERVHVLILDFCRKNCLIYFDNRNIRIDSLYKDGLHLTDKGKTFWADNFIVYLNIFLEAHSYHPPKKFFSSDFRQTVELFRIRAELHLLQQFRRKYLNNPLICYLNITKKYACLGLHAPEN